MCFSGIRGDVKVQAFWGIMSGRLLVVAIMSQERAVCGLP